MLCRITLKKSDMYDILYMMICISHGLYVVIGKKNIHSLM